MMGSNEDQVRWYVLVEDCDAAGVGNRRRLTRAYSAADIKAMYCVPGCRLTAIEPYEPKSRAAHRDLHDMIHVHGRSELLT